MPKFASDEWAKAFMKAVNDNPDYIIAMIGEQLNINAGESVETADGFTVTPTGYYSGDLAWDITVAKGDDTVTKKLTIGASTDTEFALGTETVKVRVLSNQTKTTYPEGTTVTVVSVIVGSTTEVRYQEDVALQNNPKKTQGDNRFPETDGKWRFDFTIAADDNFTRGDYIDVYYDPWNPDISEEASQNGQNLNLTVGEKVSLPNDFFDVEFAAMNTETITMMTTTSISVKPPWPPPALRKIRNPKSEIRNFTSSTPSPYNSPR